MAQPLQPDEFARIVRYVQATRPRGVAIDCIETVIAKLLTELGYGEGVAAWREREPLPPDVLAMLGKPVPLRLGADGRWQTDN